MAGAGSAPTRAHVREPIMARMKEEQKAQFNLACHSKVQCEKGDFNLSSSSSSNLTFFVRFHADANAARTCEPSSLTCSRWAQIAPLSLARREPIVPHQQVHQRSTVSPAEVDIDALSNRRSNASRLSQPLALKSRTMKQGL